jgi:hypothetical protein
MYSGNKKENLQVTECSHCVAMKDPHWYCVQEGGATMMTNA